MIEVLKAIWVPSNVHIISGPFVSDGSLKLLLNKLPNWDNVVYTRHENCIVAELEKFIRVYVHRPGTGDGFGGKEISLNLNNEGTVLFRGSLWSPTSSRDIPDSVPDFGPVSITDDPLVLLRGFTYYSAHILAPWYDELESMANPKEESH